MRTIIFNYQKMTTQNTGDDFLIQIQDTEKKHEKMVQDARDDFARKLQNEKQSLKKAREISVSKVREEEKETYAAKQKSMRDLYDKLKKEGDSIAQKTEKETAPMIDQIIPAAENFFLNAL